MILLLLSAMPSGPPTTWADKAFHLAGGGPRGQVEYDEILSLPASLQRGAYETLERAITSGEEDSQGDSPPGVESSPAKLQVDKFQPQESAELLAKQSKKQLRKEKQLQREAAIKRRLATRGGDTTGSDIHVAFTSACNKFQHWQTEVLLNSAFRVGFRGPVTRIVVGCEKRKTDHGKTTTHTVGELDDLVESAIWRRSTYPNVSLHLAPHPPLTDLRFQWFNKAWGFYHWSTHGVLLASVVAVLDPDQFFLAPLTQNVMSPESMLPSHPWLRTAGRSWLGMPDPEVTDAAVPGMGIAQKYGIGDVFIHKFNRTKVCGAGSSCATVTSRDALKYYAIGVPYLIHKADFQSAMYFWWKFMPEAFRQDPNDLQVDMYAYNMAAAHIGLRHITMRHYMVSSPSAQDEGWDSIDNMRMADQHGVVSCRRATIPVGWASPTFAHACHSFTASASDGGLWLFHKGHVPPKILKCNQPLLMYPPEDIISTQTTKKLRRAAFMLCALHRLTNEAALDYKRRYCPVATINTEECVQLTRGGRGDREFPGRFAKRVKCGTVPTGTDSTKG